MTRAQRMQRFRVSDRSTRQVEAIYRGAYGTAVVRRVRSYRYIVTGEYSRDTQRYYDDAIAQAQRLAGPGCTTIEKKEWRW